MSMWCHVIWCDVVSCVVSCHVMQCDVMRCALMWWAVICCEVRRGNGMGSYEFVMRCGWLWGQVASFEMFVCCGEFNGKMMRWPALQSTTKYYSVQHTITPYYNLLQSNVRTTRYNKGLQSTTPYYKVLHNTTKYYSVLQSTTPYYKVYSVLQSTTPYYKVLLPSIAAPYYKLRIRTTKYYSVQQKMNTYYKFLQSATPYQKIWIRLIVGAHETSSPKCGATRDTLQHHQILPPPT